MPIATRTAANKKHAAAIILRAGLVAGSVLFGFFADCEDWFLPELLDFFFVAVCAIIQLTCLYQNISESIIVRTPTTQQ